MARHHASRASGDAPGPRDAGAAGGDAPDDVDAVRSDVALECGWGRLVFGQTLDDHDRVLKLLRDEASGARDIAFYLRDPHVLVARAPDELFIDPSYTYRLWFHRYRPARQPPRGVVVRKMRTQADAEATNRIYAANHMVTADPEIMWANQRTRTFTYLIAESGDPAGASRHASEGESGDVIGTVTGIDHVRAFGDPEGGTSLWCLAVDPQAAQPGVGEALVRTLVERYQARGRSFLDLSVMHDNAAAIALYEKLGFERVPVFAVKRKNPINEPLYTPDQPEEGLNPYAKLIADEARRRGITVRVTDPGWGEMVLSHGGREVQCRESLTELTHAVAMSRCDDKRATRRVLADAGLAIPRGRVADDADGDAAFLAEVGEVVVKPARGEQGTGVTVGVTDGPALRRAVELAQRHCAETLIEERVAGQDLRVIVIDHQVVAAAVRRPAAVVGTGRHSVAELIERQSRRRAAATGGESTIPVDDHTLDTVRSAGYELDDVPPEGAPVQVRRAANLHTGGTIHDVTDELNREVAAACVAASRALDIPVVGLDLLVPDVAGPAHVFVEANERPGLANHEPQPTARRFVDLLFPQTRSWHPTAA